jgi:ABC-2 type transport system permease protein
MYQIFKKEFNGFLNSLVAYIAISVFLIGIGLLMWVFPETSVLNYGFADLETLFSFGPYVFMFLVPAITMRMFADEKKSGTLELLLTKPLTDLQIILGKYFAGFALLIFALAPTLLYYFTIYSLGNPTGNIDTAGVIGSYIGLALLGGVFISIGIFASSLTDNQVVSFILALFLCFLLYYGFQSAASINIWGRFSVTLEELGILYHYNYMSKGLIDIRNIIYFISLISIMLMLTKLKLSSRKW